MTISPTGAVEAGTVVNNVTGSKVTFDDGSYTYEATTGVAVTAREVDRVTVPATYNADVSVSDDGSFTDAPALTIGDQGGDNVVSSLKYTETVTYSDGNVAKDNLGDASNPAIKITGSSVSKTSAAITPFRKYFYGTLTTQKDAFTSDDVRALTGSTGPASNGKTFSITIPDGTKQVVIAYPATYKDLAQVKDTGAFGTDIVGSFVKSVVSVKGANNYTGIDYKVYVYSPATALGANKYDVKI